MSDFHPEPDRRGGISVSNSASNADPNREQRDYELSGESPLVGLIDNKWYPPYVEDRSHYHNCLEVGMCVAGQGRVELERRAWDYSPGAIVAAGRRLHHRQHNTGWPMTHWQYVLIDEDALLREVPDRHRSSLRRLFDATRREGLFFDAGEESDELRGVIRAIFSTYGRRGELARMEVEAMSCLLMCVMARTLNSAMAGTAAEAPSRTAIEPALRFVSENYMHELRVAEMAASCAMSVSYFRKVFAAIMGMPPLEYGNRYRINRSVNLLRSTNETVLQIAAQTGFTSIATFDRNFQRYVGKSPTEWRKTAHI